MVITAKKDVTWDEARKTAQAGDVITIETKEGKELNLFVVDADESRIRIVSDLVGNEAMYEELPGGAVTWEDSDLREKLPWIAEKILPDCIMESIAEREIEQIVLGGSITTKDRFWLPSKMEMTGVSAVSDGRTEKKFPASVNERDRIRIGEGGETWWYWLRSTNSTLRFCYVDYGGVLSDCKAAKSNGVPLCFDSNRQ